MITIQIHEQDVMLAIRILVMSLLVGSGSAFIAINYYYRSSKITLGDILVCAFGGMLIAFGILFALTQWGVVGIIVR